MVATGKLSGKPSARLERFHCRRSVRWRTERSCARCATTPYRSLRRADGAALCPGCRGQLLEVAVTPANRRRPLAATIVPLAVIVGGAGLTILGAFVLNTVTGGSGNPGEWAPSGAAAAGGWMALVLLAIAVWHAVLILTGREGPPVGEIGNLNETVRRYLTPALLGLGILLGFFFFK